jgi:hypothetical protein
VTLCNVGTQVPCVTLGSTGKCWPCLPGGWAGGLRGLQVRGAAGRAGRRPQAAIPTLGRGRVPIGGGLLPHVQLRLEPPELVPQLRGIAPRVLIPIHLQRALKLPYVLLCRHLIHAETLCCKFAVALPVVPPEELTVFRMALTRWAKRSVLSVSAMFVIAGLTLAIMTVLALPPSDSCSSGIVQVVS